MGGCLANCGCEAGQGRVSDWFDYLLFEQEELDEIFQKANWRRLRTFEENENYATVIPLDT